MKITLKLSAKLYTEISWNLDFLPNKGDYFRVEGYINPDFSNVFYIKQDTYGIYSISLPELMDKRFLTISSNIKGLIKSLEIIEVLSNPTWVNTNGETSCIFDCNCGIEIDERNYMFS